MDFRHRSTDEDPQKLEEIYEKLTAMSRQLSFLQAFMESKFGSEFSSFCEALGPPRTPSLEAAYAAERRQMNDDSEEYDKMPNLVSQESPSRTLGFVSVPLRQSSSSVGVPSHSPKMLSGHPSNSDGSHRRERGHVVVKGESLPNNEDLMYPLHNFTDLLVGNTGEADGAATTPEFMEMELDPSQLLRGEPPALQPMYSVHSNNSQIVNNNLGNHSHGGHTVKRGIHRQSSVSYKYEVDTDDASASGNLRGSNGNGHRRASVGGHENNHSSKKFDCLMCGIQFEYAETLKSHMDSHAAARNNRSSSEDQSGILEDSDNQDVPVPRLMSRSMNSEHQDPVVVKVSKSKKSRSSQQSSSSSSSSSSKTTSAKRRKRYNQSRPCSLQCPECGLKIRDKSRLIEHLRGHTGERPFHCSYCGKSYTRKDVLKTHMIKMHGDNPQDQESNDHLSNNSALEIYKSCE